MRATCCCLGLPSAQCWSGSTCRAALGCFAPQHLPPSSQQSLRCWPYFVPTCSGRCRRSASPRTASTRSTSRSCGPGPPPTTCSSRLLGPSFLRGPRTTRPPSGTSRGTAATLATRWPTSLRTSAAQANSHTPACSTSFGPWCCRKSPSGPAFSCTASYFGGQCSRRRTPGSPPPWLVWRLRPTRMRAGRRRMRHFASSGWPRPTCSRSAPGRSV